MKKIIILCLTCAILTSCATLKTENAGYESGRIVALSYLLSEDMQSPEVHAAAVLGYKIMGDVYGQSTDYSTVEQLLQMELSKQELSPAQTQLISNMFLMASARIMGDVKREADKMVVAKNFYRGMTDALSDYKHLTTPVK